MLPSGLYWSMQKCSTNGGYVCKTKRQDNQNTFTQNQTLTGSEGRFVSPGKNQLFSDEGNNVLHYFIVQFTLAVFHRAFC
jgi:hypothetical protein